MSLRRFAALAVLLLFLPAGLPAADAVLPKRPAVASANAYATDAGLEILAAGGNAFDAAVAVSATLGLVEPESSGLGGGGFFLLHLAKENRQVFIDARERAPLAATRDMYLDEHGEPDRDKAVNGALAAAIPGLPAGLVHLAHNYGRLPLERSLAPAIRLAREGWRFGPKNAAMMGFRKGVIERNRAAAGLFLVDGRVPEVGTLMRNPDYAATLERLAREGFDGFYRGELAAKLVAGVREGGGIWSEQDLAEYRVVERAPLRLRHRGHEIVTAPPPSSGGVALAQMLNILSGYDYPALARVQRVHLLVEAMRRAYRDRAIYLGDPDFVRMPIDLLMHPAYAAGLRAGISLERATPSELLPGIGAPAEREDTTHFSIVDTEGNLAAVTQTVNLPYGNAFAVAGTGFLLNNEMDDFSIKPGLPNAFGLVGDDANAIEPGKRPLSSMTPSFLVGEGRVAAIGTPGGSRIITMVLLGLLELMDGQSAQAATDLPRFHHQYLPDVISAEPDAFTPEEIAALEAKGHRVSAGERSWGNMQVVVWDRTTGAVQAGSDPRWKGVGKGATGDEAIFR
ncbi:gamma-glutamyltransferase [Rehaibacterium terrae]|jgi:gamma-glutamyltranspeptidase/glutathione hydrolase|uniref:Glutathione hydrolase proenzyme n=1 Tax=Rehaibacterium terrae TaxID=1341696 RepID=A0A7W8DEF3_9GAMM|nr:gamma-glutamyltransferase [Rehaibacterium terrae]MBB5015675.1 gamma-glutamyltranspeptidase/glutathione hydrolase [Rehaibacterium terrae]